MKTIAIVLNLALFGTCGYLLGYHNGVNTEQSFVDQQSIDEAIFMALLEN